MDETSLAATGQTDALIEEVINLLLEGVDPEELLQRGVPPEILQQAMEIVLAQSQGGGGMPAPAAPPVTDGGLAATAMV